MTIIKRCYIYAISTLIVCSFNIYAVNYESKSVPKTAAAAKKIKKPFKPFVKTKSIYIRIRKKHLFSKEYEKHFVSSSGVRSASDESQFATGAYTEFGELIYSERAFWFWRFWYKMDHNFKKQRIKNDEQHEVIIGHKQGITILDRNYNIKEEILLDSFPGLTHGGSNVVFEGEYKRVLIAFQKATGTGFFGEGFYWGGEYARQVKPVVFEYTNQETGNKIGDVDSEMAIDNYRLIFGYDTLASARKKYIDYSGFYADGFFSAGVGIITFSDDVDRFVAREVGKDDFIPPASSFSVNLDIGYLIP